MTTSAQVILTSTNSKKLSRSVGIIKRHCKKTGIEVDDRSGIKSKSKSKLWGAENPKQEIFMVNGTIENLRTIFDVDPADGVYLQLLKYQKHQPVYGKFSGIRQTASICNC